MEQKNTKSQQAHQSILDNLGNRGVQNIINDPTPFPDYVYRPNPDHFVTEVLEESKRPRLVKGGKKRR